MRPFSLAILVAAALGASAAGAAAPAKEDIAPLDQYKPRPTHPSFDAGVSAGPTSATVSWRTLGRATSRVEYGPTEACEHRTPTTRPGRVLGLPFYTQFHRITGLEPGKTYHCRAISIGTDGSVSKGKVRTFTTKSYENAIRVPDDVKGPPYVLDKDGATYVLTRDLVVPLAGFEITASDVTLDFDGHTLTYNNEPYEGPKEWSERAYKRNDFGVKCSGKGRVTIRNGRIVQGKGSSAGTQVGIGCNPVYSRGGPVTMEGMELIWHGADISGAFFHWAGDNQVHHCVFDDRGTVITNRHQAISTIDGNGWGNYAGNLIKRTRQQGLMGGVWVASNEIYVDSCATNSFGIRPSAKAGKPVLVDGNRIYGIGEHPVGIAMFGVYPPWSLVRGNDVAVKCTRSGAEYGYTGSACFRTTWGADNLNLTGNIFRAYADVYDGKVAKARAVWVGLPHFTPKDGKKEIRDAFGAFAGNTIQAIGRNGAKAGAICVVCNNESPNLIFGNNKVTSTWANVLLGDEYGHAGGYPKFVDNTFRRAGNDPNYRTILQQRTGIPGTGVFFANSYEDGASPQNIELKEKGEVAFQTVLYLKVKDADGKPLGDARVVVTDAEGKHALLDTTPNAETHAMLVSDGNRFVVERPVDYSLRGYITGIPLMKGELAVALVREIVTQDGRKAAGPYTVSAKKDGYKPASKTVDLAKTARVEITLQR
ncbi:MAG TPA: hypothetical protein VM238_21080 [Phycisphaerae bacterium]|nr:hypothetical protein [Phycisphaerae bacterium]